MTYRTEAEAWLQLVATPHEIAEQRDWSHISGVQGVTFPLVPALAPPRRSRRGDHESQLGCGFPPRGNEQSLTYGRSVSLLREYLEIAALPARFHAVASGRAAAKIFYGRAEPLVRF